MPIYTVTGEAGKALDATSRTLQSIGAQQPRLEIRSLGIDRLTWTVVMPDVSAEGLIAPELSQKISLFQDGTRIFQGHCTGRKIRFNGRSWVLSIEVSGPWWWLRQIQFTSTQDDQTGASKERPVVVFNTGNVSTSLASVVSRSIALGAPIAAGNIATGFNIPRVTLAQGSCAEALQELMLWLPDGMLWFNYAPATPTLNVTRRRAGLATGTAATQTVTVGTDVVETIDLSPRIDLQVSQVVISSVSRTASGKARYDESFSGASSPGKRQMLVISGPEVNPVLPTDTFDQVVVRSGTIKPSNVVNPAILSAYDQRLKAVGATGFSLGSKTWNLAGGGTYTLPAITTTVELEDGTALPAAKRYYLTKGEVADWWTAENIPWATARCAATIRVEVLSPQPPPNGYSPSPPDWVVQHGGMQQATFTVIGSQGVWQRVDVFYTTVAVLFPAVETLWTADTTIYRTSDYSYLQPPAGLAANLLGTQDWLPYVGSVTTAEQSLPLGHPVGKCLSVAGSLPELASIRALITGANLDLFLGRTEFQVGSGDRLSFAQLASRFRRPSQTRDNVLYLKSQPLTPV